LTEPRFTVVGLTSSVAPFRFDLGQMGEALSVLIESGVRDPQILSTNHRVEISGYAENDVPFIDLLHRQQRKLDSAFFQRLYRLEGKEAFQHLKTETLAGRVA